MVSLQASVREPTDQTLMSLIEQKFEFKLHKHIHHIYMYFIG